MNNLIIKCALSVSKLLRGMEFLISWSSYHSESILLRASLRLQKYALNKQRSILERTRLRSYALRGIDRANHGWPRLEGTLSLCHLIDFRQ